MHAIRSEMNLADFGLVSGIGSAALDVHDCRHHREQGQRGAEARRSHAAQASASVFVVTLAPVITATLVSAMASSGVWLIAFVPLVGLAVFSLKVAALLLRGVVFEYIGLTARGAYVTVCAGQAS